MCSQWRLRMLGLKHGKEECWGKPSRASLAVRPRGGRRSHAKCLKCSVSCPSFTSSLAGAATPPGISFPSSQPNSGATSDWRVLSPSCSRACLDVSPVLLGPPSSYSHSHSHSKDGVNTSRSGRRKRRVVDMSLLSLVDVCWALIEAPSTSRS
ncbi:hypothetical protein BO71DRAFT_249715 [Aspergillus ellipticus CBS 707.79]|uniref:Uncharacterized protein n=1 Tax=Aspergillus ellipticus CBS 707.79 TaxID=1448320 RepID=A0A319D8Z4_9EURO|nr:hypothetical protein BO71DRAFT_249715 [Aspergillus ellipticus CBS 707.79]